MIRHAIRNTALVWCGAAVTAAVVAAPTRAELTICNRTSYLMETAFGLEKRVTVSTRGWFRIDPGQCRQVLDGPLDADMVYVHTRTPPVYGDTPMPQQGEAELCIRPVNFTIADARACPVSQQARFSAARPTDSPRSCRSRRPRTWCCPDRRGRGCHR